MAAAASFSSFSSSSSSSPFSSSSASSSSPTISSSGEYNDVFLSFRGEDTRDNFTSHLHAALERKKIKTCFDETSLKRGEEISLALMEAIRNSKISIIVFSKNYASSSWCLRELVFILRCRREKGQFVLPIFYDVDPSHVRNQDGSYRDAFVKHEEVYKDRTDMVREWRDALEISANLSGFDSRAIRPEAKLVEQVVNALLSDDFKGQVGMENQDPRGKINDFKGLVGMEIQDPRGKINDFEGLVGMEDQDPREKINDFKGLVGMENQDPRGKILVGMENQDTREKINDFKGLVGIEEQDRRRKIGERMRRLQDLVPGCNKVTGKILVLDEIINYVQSLQRRVEFLSMKLASANTRLDANKDTVMSKYIFQPSSSVPHPSFPLDSSAQAIYGHQHQQNSALHSGFFNVPMTHCAMGPLDAALCQNLAIQLPQLNGFTQLVYEYPAFGEDDLQSIVQMGFGQNPTLETSLQPNGPNQVSI